MNGNSEPTTQTGTSVPPDDLNRNLVLARSDDSNLPHIGLVGDTYTILLSGKDTAGRFCLVDMHISRPAEVRRRTGTTLRSPSWLLRGR
jgi:hypothetical protein